jgi:hypothetical protein
MLPRLATMYDSFKWAYERDEVLAQIGGLNYYAFQQGRQLELIRYPPSAPVSQSSPSLPSSSFQPLPPSQSLPLQALLPLQLPEGWQVEAEPPITFLANGACSGGKVTLIYKDYRRSQLTMKPPLCKLE